jgi:hypothetical protein
MMIPPCLSSRFKLFQTLITTVNCNPETDQSNIEKMSKFVLCQGMK